MNQLGQTAQAYYRDYLPSQFENIPDPSGYFHQWGEQLQEAVTTAAFEIAGPDPAQETYLEKVGRLNAATMQARELILNEQLYSHAPEGQEDEEAMLDPELQRDLDEIKGLIKILSE
jgi:hypothetical protein